LRVPRNDRRAIFTAAAHAERAAAFLHDLQPKVETAADMTPTTTGRPPRRPPPAFHTAPFMRRQTDGRGVAKPIEQGATGSSNE
jgi:hypothetical protein